MAWTHFLVPHQTIMNGKEVGIVVLGVWVVTITTFPGHQKTTWDMWKRWTQVWNFFNFCVFCKAESKLMYSLQFWLLIHKSRFFVNCSFFLTMRQKISPNVKKSMPPSVLSTTEYATECFVFDWWYTVRSLHVDCLQFHTLFGQIYVEMAPMCAVNIIELYCNTVEVSCKEIPP